MSGTKALVGIGGPPPIVEQPAAKTINALTAPIFRY